MNYTKTGKKFEIDYIETEGEKWHVGGEGVVSITYIKNNIYDVLFNNDFIRRVHNVKVSGGKLINILVL